MPFVHQVSDPNSSQLADFISIFNLDPPDPIKERLVSLPCFDSLALLLSPSLRCQDTNGAVSMNVQTIQFLRNSEYKGGTGPKGKEPVSISVEVGDDEPAPPPKEEFLIEEVSSTRNKPTTTKISGGKKKSTAQKMKGFFDKAKPEDSLYGPEGSNEGVVPDGAGDPLGYLPKGLRDRCKVVDSSKLNQEQQDEAMQQYATTGTVSPEFHAGGVEENNRKEANNAKYWAERKKIEDQRKKAHEDFGASLEKQGVSGAKSEVKKGFFDHVKGPGLYGDEGSSEGGGKAKGGKPLKMPTDSAGMEHLLQNGGFENMDFDGFMEAMNMNDIDPGEFASQMRDLADVIMPEEGGSKKIDEDVRKLVEQVAEDHMKSNYTSDGKKKSGASADIWADAELEVEPAMEIDNSLQTPKHSMKVIKGEDLGDDKLEIRLQMPLCESISGVDLELESTSLVLGVEGIYSLELRLKKPVDEDRVQARFDKAAKELIITAPIKYD